MHHAIIGFSKFSGLVGNFGNKTTDGSKISQSGGRAKGAEIETMENR
jgi:hypothetical protein